MKMNNLKDGDIFRWRWNEKYHKENKLKQLSGTLYWCMSCIFIWREEKQVFEDTYWIYDLFKYKYDSRHWDKEEVQENMLLTYIDNLYNLKKVNYKSVFKDYDKDDCIDLTHPNNTSGQYFIKKSAKKSLKKKQLMIEAHITHYRDRSKYLSSQVDKLEESLKTLNNDTYTPCDHDVYIYEE